LIPRSAKNVASREMAGAQILVKEFGLCAFSRSWGTQQD
jgi:hypothetical protein